MQGRPAQNGGPGGAFPLTKGRGELQGLQSQTRLMKWKNHPNLRLGPAKPALGRGRLQVQVRRAFVGRPLLTSSEVYDSCYAKKRAFGERISQRHRHSVWRILRQIADPIGRAETIGRPALWRLKE
jgi:hypothetical protein